MQTTVVNIKSEKCDFYCGRGTIFGNPFQIGRDGTREEVIEKYRVWFKFLLCDDRFVNELYKMKGKKLGCFCKLKTKEVACHVDIIADCLNNVFKVEEDVFF